MSGYRIHNLIRFHRERKRWTREDLANQVGASVSQIVKLERSERKLTQEWIERLAATLNVHPMALMSAWATEVIGVVRGDGVVLIDDGNAKPSIVEVEAPASATPTAKAIEVEGDSVPNFAENRSVLFFDWDEVEPYHDIYGRMAVVWCQDGRVLVRRLFPGKAPGSCALVTSGGKVELEVPIKQARLVSWIRLPPKEYAR